MRSMKKTITNAITKSGEPIFEGKIEKSNDSRYSEILTWYNYNHDVEDSIRWALEYMKKNGYDKKSISSVKNAKKSLFPCVIGWQARMMLNGTILPDQSMEFFERRLLKVIEMCDKVSDTETEGTVVSVQDHVRNKISITIAVLEEKIDIVIRGGTFSVYDFLKKAEISKQIASGLYDYYKPHYDFLVQKDPFVKEAYGKNLEKWAQFYKQLISDIELYINNSKVMKVRKTRKLKVKSAIDITKNCKYLKEYNELKMASLHPSEVIGAQVLYTYNTKSRKINVFYAKDRAGLSIKGQTITNYDSDTSKQKNIRKPEAQLKQMLALGKVGQRKYFEQIRAIEKPALSRINSDTLLLRTFK